MPVSKSILVLLQETFNITEENLPSLKRAFLPEVAAQFRDGQMMPAIEFR